MPFYFLHRIQSKYSLVFFFFFFFFLILIFPLLHRANPSLMYIEGLFTQQ